jgi:hypothetical protein
MSAGDNPLPFGRQTNSLFKKCMTSKNATDSRTEGFKTTAQHAIGVFDIVVVSVAGACRQAAVGFVAYLA